MAGDWSGSGGPSGKGREGGDREENWEDVLGGGRRECQVGGQYGGGEPGVPEGTGFRKEGVTGSRQCRKNEELFRRFQKYHQEALVVTLKILYNTWNMKKLVELV